MKKRPKSKGFTLIELLVVIAIIALLLSVLVPSLKMAKEYSKRIICASNLKNIGQGVFVYAENNHQFLPSANYKTASNFHNPGNTYTIFNINKTAFQPDLSHIIKTINFGRLYLDGIIDNPKSFYCDSSPRITNNRNFRYEAYIDGAGSWPWNNDYNGSNTSNPNVVRTSYSYVPQSTQSKETETSNHGNGSRRFPTIAKKASELTSSHVMSADAVLDVTKIAHKKGIGKKGSGLNAMYSDGSVKFANDSEAFGNYLWFQSNGRTPIDFTQNDFEFRTILTLLK